MSLAELTLQIGLARDAESNRFQESMDGASLAALIQETYERYDSMITSGGSDWVSHFPGKPIFSAFCGKANISQGRLKSLYIKKGLEFSPNPFNEIIADFEYFAQL